MKEAFGANTEEGRRLILVQAEQAVLSTLEQYEIGEEAVHFIQISDHITYQIMATSGEMYLLRIHPEPSSRDEIQSELLWLDWLAAKGLVVPVGIQNQDGTFMTMAETDQGIRWPVTILRLMDGEQLEGEPDDKRVYRMGVLMARLHLAAQEFVPPAGFARPTWGEGSLDRDMRQMKEHFYLSADDIHRFEQAVDKIKSCTAGFVADRSRFGMIHGDFHEGNLVFREGEPYPIDFGRCGFGYYLYDMAQALIGIHPMQRQMFIAGYESMRLLKGDYRDKLESFFVQALIGNLSFIAANPQEGSMIQEQKLYVLAVIQHYLNGLPFLFARG